MAAAVPSLLWRGSPSGLGRWGAIASRAAAMDGWRRRVLLILLGGLATLALPPLGALPVLLPSLCGLVWVLEGARTRRHAFGVGWWWAWAWYAIGFYWIGNAMLVDPERFGWMIPFATLGLGAVQAVFIGIATLLTHLTRVGGISRVLVLAGMWTVMEWVRAWFLTGFPWNPLGSVWDAVPAVLQLASVVGVFGLCGFTILVFALPAALADFLSRRQHRLVLAAVVALLGGAVAFGQARLAAHPTETVPGIRLRLVQAAIAQRHMWRDDLRKSQLLDHVELSRGPGFDAITHVVWPETAAPFFLDLDVANRAVAATAAPVGGMLLTGAPRITPQGVLPMHLWNSLMALDASGQVRGVYDKVHLVPFGEYVPLRGLLPIDKLTAGGMDFSAGAGLRTLDIPGLPPVGPFICYEAVFPGQVVGRDQKRPEWLLTVTNDGWFGKSAGPHQHLAAGRMRAVEEGLPLVRSANTGISAIIDPLGREMHRLALGQRGVVDGELPRSVSPTLYGRWGNAVPLILAGLLLLLGMLGKISRISRA
ncbi:apolipoprotein N-acyltransferase [Magnetospirillum sulfuroxidans]|uniref:Apolipoprotein N-acyltransferase n=1 Tax=Magnetospirillum sulfuroxidans TaxID=611300 RepID=A0ABS5IF43_9PROT|nr:apolipoprotein N-acyltransferase [Magnetospirillum sulfuroxidans]MBR9972949.1 apolipoprotein N-acyltransferase [Magnetospirillum sulfuroxidans]